MKKIFLFGVTILATVTLTACGGDKSSSDNIQSSSSSSSEQSSKVAESSSSQSSSSASSSSKNVYKNVKNYDVSWEDNSWSGLNLSINKVDVGALKTAETNSSDETFEGIIRVHFEIDNTERDLSAYPDQATLLTSDGQQVDADLIDSDDVGGDLMKGVKKSGDVYFLIPKMSDSKNITNVRLTFTANYDTDDFDDDNYHKDYDTGILDLN